KRLIVVIEPLIALLPDIRLLTPELFANTHEPGDVYPIVQDCADPLGRGVLLFLTSQESFATRSGANQLMTLSGRSTATGPSMSPTTTSGLPLVRSRSAVRRTKSIGVIQGSLLRTCA